MALVNKRIIDLPERAELNSDDYTVVDGSNGGTAKYKLSKMQEDITTVDQDVEQLSGTVTQHGQQLTTINQTVTQNTSDITDLKADLSNNAVSKNLLGPSAGVLYPCFISANKKVTLYTSDNETGAVFEFSTYDKDGVRTHYWNIPNVSTPASRTVTVPDNAYYVSWKHLNQKMTGLPMCEIGDTVTGFAEWFPPVKVIQQEIEDLTEDIDIAPNTTVNGYVNSEGNWALSSSFQISKYPVQEGDVLVLDIAFPFASSGGVFQFQNNISIPMSNNPYIVGTTYTEAFQGLMVVPEGATWLMVTHQTGVNSNIVRLRQAKGIADLQEAVSADRHNYDYKLRNFKQSSDQYKKGNTSGTWYDRFVLIQNADNHIGTSFAQKNLKELTSIENDTAVNAVVDCGDITNAGRTTYTRETTNAEYDIFTGICTEALSASIPLALTLGNHDANDVSGYTPAENTSTKLDQWTHVFEPIKNKYPSIVWGDLQTYRHYNYVDISKGNYTLRIISLDMLDHDDYEEGDTLYDCHHCAVYSQRQIDWLCNTALNVGDNYGIIINNHFPFAPYRTNGYSEEWPALQDGTFAQGWKMIPEIVRAWTERTTLTKTYADNKLGLNNINVNVDFSGVPTGALFVCYMAGHTHSKNAYTVKEENGENFGQLMLCEDSSGQQGSALNRVYKYDDGIQNTAASQVTIDMAERKVYRTAYGACQHCSEAQKFPTAIFEF